MSEPIHNTAPVNAAAIERLTWMAGSWSGAVDDDPVDEHWALPAGGVMIGMFRWMKHGRLYLYELLVIEPENDGLVLRLKHFDLGLHGWEEKAMAIAYPLVSVGEGEAVFEKGGSFRSSRFTYQRVGMNELLVITEDRKGDDQEGECRAECAQDSSYQRENQAYHQHDPAAVNIREFAIQRDSSGGCQHERRKDPRVMIQSAQLPDDGRHRRRHDG